MSTKRRIFTASFKTKIVNENIKFQNYAKIESRDTAQR